MGNIQVILDKLEGFMSQDQIFSFHEEINRHFESIRSKTGKGNDFLGWVDLPELSGDDLLSSIEDSAYTLAACSEIIVVTGIGGSYLGARAVIDALNHQFASLLSGRKSPLILYAGHNIGEDYLTELLDILDQRDYSIIVISKSGTTTEPAIAFRILKNHLEGKYGKEEAVSRIIAITDKEKGALKELADKEGYPTFVVPDDVGGRYSVLTSVGLLPIAAAGYNIRELLKGAGDMKKLIMGSGAMDSNPAALYVAARNALYRQGKTIEIMVSYQPKLYYLTEWWKQLFGESEGKENKGIFPAGVGFTTDLHSMGQYIQEGLRNIFETVLSVEKTEHSLLIPENKDNADSLNYLAGRHIDQVNKMAELGTSIAHVDGGVPNIRISIPEVNEYYLGQLIYFFEMSCALSGYILDVNPFDQPGVEAYKKNMFALLGKPGFEEETAAIRKRISRE
ncbi:MAG: glucose-6-phosphate isomerase [Bacteroidales bacterium]|nr:glucose-6-phosphate isomerase [Bacteroidales bacterium]